MRKVKFKHEAGLCPFFMHDGKYFFINQKKIGNGYGYQLEVKDLWVKYKSIRTRKCISANAVVRRFLKNKRFEVSSCGRNDSSVYFCDGLLFGADDRDEKITIRPLSIPLSGSFKYQQDCIKFAEKYIAEHYLDHQVGFLGGNHAG